MKIKYIKEFLKSIKLPHPYFMPFLTMICAASIMLMYLILEEYYTNYTNLSDKLCSESERIERSFSDVIRHTEFIMKVILMQIKKDHKNLKHIENVINKYSVNPHLNNVLAWTVFCWFDEKGVKRVDSVSGTAVKRSHRTITSYFGKAEKDPGKLYVGGDMFGFTSQRHIIPAAIGAHDGEGNIIGYLTVGFDLLGLSDNLIQKLKDPDITFAILNQNFDIINQYNNFSKNKKNIISPRSIKKIVEEEKIDFHTLTNFSKSNLLLENNSVHIHRVPNYPFAIYLQYNNQNFIKSLRKDIIYRVSEVFVLTLVSFGVIVFIYRREKVLRDKAEYSKNIAIKALQSKTDFLAYTAHELRSPLSFIVSSSEMMSNKLFGPISVKYLDYIKNINQSGRELTLFIDDLLDNMKLQKGNFDIKEEIVNVKDVIQRSVKVNCINFNDKMTVETQFQQNLPMVHSDSKRLLQIFNNIISNAMKYSPENSSLKIDVKMYKGEMFIHFHDKGYGMSEEGLQKSMHEYETVHNKNDINVKSVGLGLPLMKSLLELMEIKFFIDSKLGRGTKITIVIPNKKIKKGNT